METSFSVPSSCAAYFKGAWLQRRYAVKLCNKTACVVFCCLSWVTGDAPRNEELQVRLVPPMYTRLPTSLLEHETHFPWKSKACTGCNHPALYCKLGTLRDAGRPNTFSVTLDTVSATCCRNLRLGVCVEHTLHGTLFIYSV